MDVNIRRTKIVCTIGPASNSEEKIAALIAAGMNVARLNFSHGTHADHAAAIAALRRISRRMSKPVAILQDLQGPKIRTGTLAGLATTISNSAGPILNIYFLVLNLDKRSFIGTVTMFFAFANVAKLPIFIGQDVFHREHMLSLLAVVPLVYLGAFGGKKFLEWISQLWFNRIVLALTAVAGCLLVITNWPV